MAAPADQDWRKVVRLGKYLKMQPRAQMWFEYQVESTGIAIHTDTRWAGCRWRRRSTTGGIASHGTHILRMRFKTQATVALSSAEAQLYGIARASAEGLGLVSMFKHFGLDTNCTVVGDASAASAIICRQGVGRLRHLDTSYRWAQEKAALGTIDYQKVHKHENPADLSTDAWPWTAIKKHIKRLQTDTVQAKKKMGDDLHVWGPGHGGTIGLHHIQDFARSILPMLAWVFGTG